MENIVCSYCGTQSQIRVGDGGGAYPCFSTPLGNEIVRPRVPSHSNASQVSLEAGEDDHELGEESAKEEDPIVEFAPEPQLEPRSTAILQSITHLTGQLEKWWRSCSTTHSQ